jgi:hypothetical protein
MDFVCSDRSRWLRLCSDQVHQGAPRLRHPEFYTLRRGYTDFKDCNLLKGFFERGPEQAIVHRNA